MILRRLKEIKKWAYDLCQQLGAHLAAKVASLVMLLPQVVVCGYLYLVGQAWNGLAVFGLILIQIGLMKYFINQPIERALFYSGFGVPLFVSGMMVAAFGIRHVGS